MSGVPDPTSIYGEAGRLRPPPAVMGAKIVRMWVGLTPSFLLILIGVLNLPPKGSNNDPGNMVVAIPCLILGMIMMYLSLASVRWDYQRIGSRKAEWILDDYLKENHLKAKTSIVIWSRHPNPEQDFKFEGLTKEYPIAFLDAFIGGEKCHLYPYWVIDEKTKETSLLLENYEDGVYSYTNILDIVDKEDVYEG